MLEAKVNSDVNTKRTAELVHKTSGDLYSSMQKLDTKTEENRQIDNSQNKAIADKQSKKFKMLVEDNKKSNKELKN